MRLATEEGPEMTPKEAEAMYEAQQKAKQDKASKEGWDYVTNEVAATEAVGGEGIEPETTARDECNAFRNKTTTDQKRVVLLAHCKNVLKMSRADAIMTVALGKIETRWDCIIPNDDVKSPLDPADFPPCPCVTALGWEGDKGVHWSTWNDAEAKAILTKFDAVGNASTDSNFAMEWKKKPGLHDPWLHALFKEALMVRSKLITRYFSIGMNQINLANASGELAPPGSSNTPGTPSTWQELFDFYTLKSGTPHLQASVACGWTWKFMVEGRAIDPSASDDMTIDWLKKQTGKKVVKDYYFGTGAWSGSGGGFKAARDQIRALYDSMYP